MPSMKNSAQITLALIVTLGFFSCIFWMLKWGFPIENKDPLNSLLGVLITIFTLQMNFFFGSSSASKAKDETISDIARSMPVPTSTVSSPVTIPNADSVTVKTESGNVNVTKKDEL